MKRILLFFIGILFLVSVYGQTQGQLNISVKTSEAGGNYAPKHVLAIWIEDANGNFVKTLLAYANYQITHLNTWQASTLSAGTEFNVVDAITGVTKTSHNTRECLWNGLDYNQNLMPDGTYRIWFELTDRNNTGNYSYFEFNKGEEIIQLNPFDVPSFSNISISWEPSGIGIAENITNANYTITNNPGNGLYKISGDHFDKIDVFTVSGNYIASFESNIIDIKDQSKGIYLLKIYDSDKLTIKKVLKR